MKYLEQLRSMVAEEFNKAAENPNSKEQIDVLAKMKTLVDGAVEEQNSIETEKKELLKSYSDAVAHQSFKDESSKPTNNLGEEPVSFEEVLSKFIIK